MTDLAIDPTATWPELWPPMSELADILANHPYTRHDFVQGARLIAQGGFDLPLEVALNQAWREGPGTMTAYARRLLSLIPSPEPQPTAPRPLRGPFLADKECSGCGANPAEYYTNSTSKDRLTSQCADCVRGRERRKARALAVLRDRHWQEYEAILAGLP